MITSCYYSTYNRTVVSKSITLARIENKHSRDIWKKRPVFIVASLTRTLIFSRQPQHRQR